MQNYSDPKLVALYLESKDLRYLTELFTRHSDIVYRTALRTMKNPSDAEDIMQAAYIKMMSNMHLYKGTGSVLGWMLQMVVYSCYDQLRSEKSRLNRERKIMSERTPMTTPKNEELKEMIDAHLGKLPEIYRAPITLQILEGLSIKEVSEVLQIPEKTIRSQITRGLEKLKISLQNVGVTASVITLGDSLKEIHQPLAPEIYKSSQYYNGLYQQKALASAKLAVTTSAKSFAIQKILTISLLVVGSIGGMLFLNHLEKKAEATSISTIIGKKWDFENTKELTEYQDIGLLNGAIAIQKSVGENQTNGLLVEEKSLIELDVSKYKMPIKISYKTNYYFPKDSTLFGQMIVKSNYLNGQKVFFFTGLREKIKAEYKNIGGKVELNGNWYSNVFYIDEKSIDYWVEDQRSQVLLGQSSQNKKVFLSIYGKAIIDNLKIESIEKNSLPDKSLFEKVALTTEIKEGMNTYAIEKEKIGISKNSTANPQLDIMTLAEFEKNFGSNPIGIYPSLNEEKNIVWKIATQKVVQQYKFEDMNEMYDFKLIRGLFGYGEGKGVDKSNGVAVDRETFLEIEISKYKLPLKITFSFDCLVSKNQTSKGFVMAKSNYQDNKNILFFTQLSPAPVLVNLNEKIINENSKNGFYGIWLPAVIYVSEDAIDQWLYGNRAGLTLGSSKDNKKLYLNFKDKTYFDNFTIESIEPSDVPDVSVFKNFAATLPFVKSYKPYYKLDKEKKILSLDENTTPELGICDNTIVESSFGPDKKTIVKPIGQKNKKP